MICRTKLAELQRDRRGSVSVQATLLITMFVGLLGASVEAGYAYWQYNAAHHAARMGVRIAATSDPVALSLTTMTGYDGSTEAGDPLPAYSITCTGSNQACTQGNFDQAAFNRILYGKDTDGVCAATSRERRGMCDYLDDIEGQNISVTYQNSGFGIVGNPADVVPLITVTVTGLTYNFLFLDIVTGESLSTMPDVSITAMSEDLKTGS